MGVTLCAITTGAVLVTNLIILTWVAIGNGFKGALGTLQQGSCQKTKDLSLWVHLAINVLSTLLLGASNYTMQCLSSPTREEIDTAHRRRTWLDIGIPSLRNLKQISKGRYILWWLMALSSIPLHLLYNSVVFSTLSAQEYSVFAASADFVNGTALNWTNLTNYTNTGTYPNMQHFQNATDWQRLDNRDCIKAYGQNFVSAHGDLLVISPVVNDTEMIILLLDSRSNELGDVSWMCDEYQDCTVNDAIDQAANWTIYANTDALPQSTTYPVQYCLSQPVEEQCRVQISLVILSIVVACNACKALCMLLTIRGQKSQPLVTLGDAVESFLQEPDLNTERMCLASKRSFKNARMKKRSVSPGGKLGHFWQGSRSNRTTWTEEPIEWSCHRHWWFASASLKRWLVCNIL